MNENWYDRRTSWVVIHSTICAASRRLRKTKVWPESKHAYNMEYSIISKIIHIFFDSYEDCNDYMYYNVELEHFPELFHTCHNHDELSQGSLVLAPSWIKNYNPDRDLKMCKSFVVLASILLLALCCRKAVVYVSWSYLGLYNIGEPSRTDWRRLTSFKKEGLTCRRKRRAIRAY